MRKVISLIVVLMLFFSSVPATVFAEEHNNQVTEEISNDSNSPDVSQETKADNIDTVTEDKIEVETPETESDSPSQQEDEFVVQGEAETSSTDKKVTDEKPVQQSEDTETPTEEKAETEVQESAAKEQEEEQPKYNALGIKEGTMVYGIDISKLSAEELQYIPIDWRDGVDETEEESASEPRFYARASYPNVNDWIKKNSPSTASIKYEHKSQFAKFNYRYGRGAVEGVVAHETANPNSSIRSEINYMTANHNNAFVHAFVDHNNIIEIHPTDLGAWGAGYYANQRFVHVELVEVNSFENFAKSINNYADYIAYVLAKYDLGVTSAESNGRGTLWSHSAVSRFLGGTNHVDPHGYFAKYGYNWNDFVKLVTEKYNQKAIKYSSTSKLGHIRTTSARIYPNLSNLSSSTQAGSSKTDQVYYIKKQANVNGTIYYLLSTKPSATSGTIGWMKASDVKVHDHKGLNRDKYMYTIVGTGAAYDKAWGGSKNQVYNLASMKGQIFTSNLSETVGNNTWIRGTLNGKEVWVHSSFVTDKRQESNISKLGHLRSGARIYQDAKTSAKYRNAGSKDYDQVYYIKKQIEREGQLFYLISYAPSRTKDVVGWVKAEQLQVRDHTSVSKTAQTLYVTGSGKSYSKAWGGSKNLVSSNLSAASGKPFYVNLTEKVGSNTWYRGTLDGKQMWLHSAYVSAKIESKTSRLGHLRGGAVILTAPGVTKGAKNSADGYTNQVYYIKKQAVYNKKTYYLISSKPSSTSGTIGWVESGQIKTYSHVTVDKKSKTLHVKGTGSAYAKAWGGSKDFVYDLKGYAGKEFQVNLTEKVGNNTWYRGILAGKEVWIHSAYLQ